MNAKCSFPWIIIWNGTLYKFYLFFNHAKVSCVRLSSRHIHTCVRVFPAQLWVFAPLNSLISCKDAAFMLITYLLSLYLYWRPDCYLRCVKMGQGNSMSHFQSQSPPPCTWSKSTDHWSLVFSDKKAIGHFMCLHLESDFVEIVFVEARN